MDVRFLDEDDVSVGLIDLSRRAAVVWGLMGRWGGCGWAGLR